MRDARPHVPALNGIRFVAAFCVIFGHAISSFKGLPADTIYSLVNLANAGMSLFFVLSGFVLTYNYGDLSRQGWKAVKIFSVSRAARILPLYFAWLLLSIWYFGTGSATIKGWAAHLTLTQTWWPQHSYPMIFRQFPHVDIAWSISSEWFFYLMFGPVCFLTWSIRDPLKGAAAVWIGIVAFVVYAAYYMTPGPFVEWLIYYSPYLRIFEFLIGCMLCRYALYLSAPTAAENTPSMLLPILALVLLIVALETFSPRGQTLLTLFKWCGGYTLPAAIMVFWSFRYRNAFMSSRFMNVAGEVSYGFYLMHFWCLIAISMYLPPAVTLKQFTINFAAAVALNLVVSLVVYQLFERPSRSLIRYLFIGRQKSPETYASAL